MAAGNLDLHIEQGATFQRQLTLKDSGGTPVDLTGRTFRGKVKDNIQGDLVATFSFTLLDQITDTGKVLITLTAAETAAIPVPKGKNATRTSEDYIYDVEMVLTGGEVERVIQGKITVSAEVTT